MRVRVGVRVRVRVAISPPSSMLDPSPAASISSTSMFEQEEGDLVPAGASVDKDVAG